MNIGQFEIVYIDLVSLGEWKVFSFLLSVIAVGLFPYMLILSCHRGAWPQIRCIPFFSLYNELQTFNILILRHN
jgi:hypothetical protein